MAGSVAGGSKTVGDIVIARVPFTDLSGSKSRPVVLVADAGMGDWVVCAITGAQQRRPEDLQITRQDMRSGGLRRDSWVRTDRLYASNHRLFSDAIGRLAEAKRAEISATVRSLF